jgi:lipoprotein-anchoring transpeptidase ErfK/SrfK
MRIVPIAAGAGVALALSAAGGSLTAVASARHAQFAAQASALQQEWTSDVAKGVPASNIAPLRAKLQSSAEARSAWWSPHWWGATGTPLLSDLRKQTTTVWTAAMTAGRTQAQSVVTLYAQLAQQLGSFIPANVRAAAATWPDQISAAKTPAQLRQLSQTWLSQVATTRTQAQAAQLAAQLNDQASGYGGVDGLLTDARNAVSIAGDDNLDTGQVPALITAVEHDFQNNVVLSSDASSVVQQLVTADSALRSLISLNDNVNGLVRPLQLSLDQAAAEGTPNSGPLTSQFQTAQNAFHDARTSAALTAVQGQLNALQNSVNTELAANVCGHNVGSGKVITLNLALQEGVFYQDGCVVKATPITTGRPELRTPTGTFSIFYKQSPFQFISPWPPSSPYYYYPSWTNWVMEFASGGYFIHDAPWEPNWQYGPGSENSSGASHGCVHIPSDVMQWLYGWTPDGTAVIIT